MTRQRVILFIADLSAGGAERVVSILANSWASSETTEVLVVVLFDTQPFYALDPRVRYISLGMKPNAPTMRRLADYVRAARGLRLVLLRERPTFVLSFMNKYNVFCLAAALGTRTPIIASERDSPTEPGRRFNWALRRMFYPQAAGIVTQSEASRQTLLARISCRDIVVIPNPVNPIGTPNRAAHENVILNVGRLVEKKGQRDLLAAFAALDAPDWRLVLCGDGPLRQRLEEHARALGIADRVEFTGTVTDVGAQLDRARIFAFPSLFEGFPNALAEAMIAGVPAVSYDCPTGPSELIEHGQSGYLVAVGDVDGLARHLRLLMTDPDRRDRLSRNARKLADKLDATRIAQRYFDFCAAAATRANG